MTVDNSKGDVIISGAQFATDGYRVGGEAITTDTANTLIRVGDGTVDGANYTATIDSVIRGTGGLKKAISVPSSSRATTPTAAERPSPPGRCR